MKNPCNRCNYRNAYCHATCPDYIGFQRENDSVREKRRLEKEANAVLYGQKKGLRIANYRKSYERL